MVCKPGVIINLVILWIFINSAAAQPCSTLGQTPSTAFPVCGTSAFVQNNVPICSSNDLFVPGCVDGANYANKNPFWYRFTAFTSGTLGFVITPNDPTDDYDWQLYDVTGLDPNQVLTNRNIIVSGNWAGNPGPTGTSANGADFIQCASPYVGNEPRFAKMPNLIAGHEYILLVSHFTNSQRGYTLTFGGGTAVITDPAEPHLEKAEPDCEGRKITLKLNKKVRCNSLSGPATEFRLVPAAAGIVSVVPTNCSSSFDFDEITITLASGLPTGNYQLQIGNGTDNNTLLDICGRGIPAGEQTAFTFTRPMPIPIDSVATVKCAPGEIKLHFSKKIKCSSIAPDGSNFLVNGPVPLNVVAAEGNCIGGLSDIITVKFSSPVYDKGRYTVTPRLSVGGGAVMDECGQVIQPSPVNFMAADTVSALFSYSTDLGCLFDTMTFAHNGDHDVNQWKWTFNNNQTFTTASHKIVFPASSSNSVRLDVSNGVCSASSAITITLDNEVRAGFDMAETLCPEDKLILTNTTTGTVNEWRWNLGVGTSRIKTPAPFQFPPNNVETNYTISLVAINNSLGCSDTISKVVKVLNSCFIAVPSAFTPNGDGLNDFLYPTNALKADNLQFKIFNRWGQLVFESKNWRDKWNGTIKGIRQDSGIYVWFLQYTHRDTGRQVFQKGTTMLIR